MERAPAAPAPELRLAGLVLTPDGISPALVEIDRYQGSCRRPEPRRRPAVQAASISVDLDALLAPCNGRVTRPTKQRDRGKTAVPWWRRRESNQLRNPDARDSSENDATRDDDGAGGAPRKSAGPGGDRLTIDAAREALWRELRGAVERADHDAATSTLARLLLDGQEPMAVGSDGRVGLRH